MRFRSLRSRLLATSAALIVGVTLATVAYVSLLADRTVGARLIEDLERSRKGVAAAEAEQFGRLQLIAELVASFPELRALLATDAPTVRDFLADYRERHGHEGLLIALGPTGQVVARSDTFAPLALPDVERTWLAPLAEGRSARGFVVVDGKVHHAVAAAAESGGTVFGVVLAASPIDDRWAASLREAIGADVVVLSPSAVEASSLPRARLTWQTDADLPADLADRPVDLSLTGERFRAIAAAPDPTGPRRIVVLQSRDQALAPYRNLQLGLIALGVIAALLGLAGSAWLAKSITAPVGDLVRATGQVAAGDFHVRLDVPRDDEIGHLARAFNHMTAGLRERADMAKFMSASTMEMIQKRPEPGVRVGERKVITVLFTDIRGFTSFSEQRPPEEAVSVLNRYLSLQANLVKRFHGDVDKFMGDAVFAHFDGPDMALDAIRCGLEIQRAIAPASPSESDLAIGVGIATGDVLVGSIGSDDRLDYTAIGVTVNLAERLCASAEAGQILLCAETFSRVSGLVAATVLPPLTVKGFSAPVTVYAMSGRDTAR
jgi:class 3 adenylate cyclase